MIRHITIPESIDLRIVEDAWSFLLSLAYVLATDDRFNRTAAGIKSGMRIEAAFEGHKPGDTVQIGNEDWRLGCAAFEAPTHGWCHQGLERNGKPYFVPGKKFLSYIEAWSDQATRDAPGERKE